MSSEPLKKDLVADEPSAAKASLQLRVGHLLRIQGYLDYAILSMWTRMRAEIVMGMAEASVQGEGPGGVGGPDEKLLVELRALIREAREYHASGNFPAAMARMRVAEDLAAVHTIRITVRLTQSDPTADNGFTAPLKVPFDAPIATVWRGDFAESVHRGRHVVRDTRGETLDSLGDPSGHVHLRSVAKPFQALPLVFSGAAEAFGISGEELAVACASHSAEPRHLAAVRSILRKAGLSEDYLQSGVHPPMHAPTAARLVKGGEEPRPIHGNCSGKHAGMLAVCAHAGWDPAGYRDPEGPLQRLVRRTVAKLCGLEPGDVKLAGDGCGVPVFALPLENLALGFARLGAGGAEEFPEDLLEAVRKVRDAMRTHPFMVAGAGRFDTRLMQSTDLVAMSGAE
ncbi:MAG: asparaginase, partial [Actinomycetota bacterium]|nr:asparaginase [Actinomycetota bacterium]